MRLVTFVLASTILTLASCSGGTSSTTCIGHSQFHEDDGSHGSSDVKAVWIRANDSTFAELHFKNLTDTRSPVLVTDFGANGAPHLLLDTGAHTIRFQHDSDGWDYNVKDPHWSRYRKPQVRETSDSLTISWSTGYTWGGTFLKKIAR